MTQITVYVETDVFCIDSPTGHEAHKHRDASSNLCMLIHPHVQMHAINICASTPTCTHNVANVHANTQVHAICTCMHACKTHKYASEASFQIGSLLLPACPHSLRCRCRRADHSGDSGLVARHVLALLLVQIWCLIFFVTLHIQSRHCSNWLSELFSLLTYHIRTHCQGLLASLLKPLVDPLV